MRRVRKAKGPKTVSYQLIPKGSEQGEPMYNMLAGLVEQHHDDLTQARIALAWCTSWKPDVDGRVILGKCKKASDLDRELAAFDFIILLSRSFWFSLSVTDEQRLALLDHELSHAAVKTDPSTGEPEYDQRGRIVYRTRKHDLEEFAAVVERHGLYKRDLETFAQALARHLPERVASARTEAQAHIANCEKCGGTGFRPIESGSTGHVRCECFDEAQQITRAVEASL